MKRQGISDEGMRRIAQALSGQVPLFDDPRFVERTKDELEKELQEETETRERGELEVREKEEAEARKVYDQFLEGVDAAYADWTDEGQNISWRDAFVELYGDLEEFLNGNLEARDLEGADGLLDFAGLSIEDLEPFVGKASLFEKWSDEVIFGV